MLLLCCLSASATSSLKRIIGLPPTGSIMAGSPDSANDVDLRQDFDGTNLECLLLQAGSDSSVSPMTQPLTATSMLATIAPHSTLACTTSAEQLQQLPPSSLINSQSRAASGDSSLQVHLLPSATTSLDKRHASTPDRAELQNDPEVIAAVANGALAAPADPATSLVQENPAAQADLATTIVQGNPAAQADLGTAAPTSPRQTVASLNGRSFCESATHEDKSSVWSKGDELQVDEASSEQRHAAAKDGHLQQSIETADNAALDAAGLQSLMQEEQEDHVAGMPVAVVLLRQHSYIQQAANMAPVATATMSPTAEEKCDAVVGSHLCADSLHEEHNDEAPLHGHLELQQSHAFSKAVSEGGDMADGQISQLPESVSQPSAPAHQPCVHAHQSGVSANQPSVYARQVSMSACEATLADEQTVPAHRLGSSACQLSMLTNQQDAAAHMQSVADQAQANDSAAEDQQGQQQQKQNMGLLRVSSAHVDHAKGQSCLALYGEQQTRP